MKTFEVITICLVDKIKNITQSKWNKLMFFVDGYGASQNNQFTNFNYIKMPFGPVPENYSNLLFEMNARDIIKTNKAINGKISLEKSKNHDKNYKQAMKILNSNKALKNAIEYIIKTFKDWTATKLADFSHEFDGWQNPEMYQIINLEAFKNDSFLKKEFQESNFAQVLLK